MTPSCAACARLPAIEASPGTREARPLRGPSRGFAEGEKDVKQGARLRGIDRWGALERKRRIRELDEGMASLREALDAAGEARCPHRSCRMAAAQPLSPRRLNSSGGATQVDISSRRASTSRASRTGSSIWRSPWRTSQSELPKACEFMMDEAGILR